MSNPSSNPVLSGALALCLGAVASAAWADGHQTEIVSSEHTFMLTPLAEGLEHPWGMDWLPDGRMVVTERPGRIRIVSADGTIGDPLAGVPAITSEFRDGLLDISVSPTFSDDSTVFFAYSELQNGLRWLKIASARLGASGLEGVTTIFESDVKVEKDQGFGARIRFDSDGNLVVSVGDHAAAANAQNTANTLGTIIRITATGAPAAGNPGGALHPAIHAYGFKNVQGMAFAADGTLWATDHGGVGGGEVNRIVAGANYGWPARTFSSGDAPRAQGARGDFTDPVFTWGAAPTVALSGLEVYTGDAFPNWKGDLFTGALVREALVRVMLDDSARHVIGTEYVLDGEIGRVRDVRQGPDGLLYVLNDDPEGGVYRIDPVK